MKDTIPKYGPLYKETNLEQIIVEPWATYSNFLFTIFIIYWFVKIWQQRNEYKFIFYALIVLSVGNVGGCMYHAKRDIAFWLLLDALPIMILTLSAGIYFWVKTKSKWYIIVASVLIPFGLVTLVHTFFDVPDQSAPNIGYAAMAVSILTPVIIYLYQTKFRYLLWIVLSLSGFGVAIFFRIIDLDSNIPFLPMGTHWLWHIFGAISTNFLILFAYLIRKREIEEG